MPKQSTLFSIVTPSFNNRQYLPLCFNSISDQNIDHEHIVIDGISSDGTIGWLKSRTDVISIIEEDEGMYDAINKGIQLAKGDIISYLNCDEQYLPGTLQKVADYFGCHPKVDLLFGNTLIIHPDGRLLSYRKSFVPRWQYVWGSFLYVYTSSMFVRRRVFESGLRFDKRWKAAGDADFVVRALRNRFSARHLSQYFSTFMITGANLSTSHAADQELSDFHNLAPLWLRHSDFITHTLIRLEKYLHGGYSEKFPFSYSVYTVGHPDNRTKFIVSKASPLWKKWEIS